MLRVIFLSVISFSAIFISSCASDDKKSDTAEAAFEQAQAFEKADRYEEAIRHYNIVKTRFPYSKLAIQAELAAADVYFKEESFAEAQVAYQAFKELHPKHPQMDYVTFRLGMSYFEQLPSTVERDLGLAQSAILFFDEVINRYGTSEFAKEATQNRAKTLMMLAEKELQIGDFYFKREKYDSALSRYESLLKTYPNLGFDAQTLKKAALAAKRNGDLDRAKKIVLNLKKQFPGSPELAEAELEVK